MPTISKNRRPGRRKDREAREKRLAQHVNHLAHYDWNLLFPAYDLIPYWNLIMTELLRDPSANVRRILSSMDHDESVRIWKVHLTAAADVARHVVSQDWSWSQQNRKAPRVQWVYLVGSLAKGTAISPSSADVDLVVDFKGFCAPMYPELLEWLQSAMQFHSEYAGVAELRKFYFFMPILHDGFTYDDGAGHMPYPADRTGISLIPEKKLRAAENSAEKGNYPWWKIERLVKNGSGYVHIPSTNKSVRPDVDVLVGGFENGFPPGESFRDVPSDSFPYYSSSAAIEATNFIRNQSSDVVITAIRALKSWCAIAKDAKPPSSEEVTRGKAFLSGFTVELMAVWLARQGGISTPKALFSRVLSTLGTPGEDWPKMTFRDYYDPALALELAPHIAWDKSVEDFVHFSTNF